MKSFTKSAAAAALLVSVSSANAALITEDFDSFATGSYASLSTADYTMTSNQASIGIVTNAPWGTRSITHSDNQIFTVDFTSTVDMFSINFGDYNADVDNAQVWAYDSLNNLIGTSTAVNPAPSYDQTLLSISVANIAKVEFRDLAPYPGIVWWDNMSFNTTSSQVSEPGALSLLGLGLLGLSAVRRKTKAA